MDRDQEERPKGTKSTDFGLHVGICVQIRPSTAASNAATLAGRSFRTLIAIAAKFDLELIQYDVVNAFVRAKIDQVRLHQEVRSCLRSGCKDFIRIRSDYSMVIRSMFT